MERHRPGPQRQVLQIDSRRKAAIGTRTHELAPSFFCRRIASQTCMTVTRLLRISNQRLRSLWRKDQIDSELGRELAFHFEQLVAESVAEGMGLEQARQTARRLLGNPGL